MNANSVSVTFAEDLKAIVNYFNKNVPVKSKVCIGASSSFYEFVSGVVDVLKIDYEILDFVKPPLKDPVHQYEQVHKNFMQSLLNADVYLAINLAKHNIDGYIGPSVFLEIGFAITNNLLGKSKTRVILLNQPNSKCMQQEMHLWQSLGWIDVIKSR